MLNLAQFDQGHLIAARLGLETPATRTQSAARIKGGTPRILCETDLF
jgi:hypothetical protein